MTSALNEAIEGYAETTKDLVRKWSDYASQVTTKLDSGYDADSASADLGAAVSLAIETAARLTWEALDAITALADAPDRPYIVESEEFPSPLGGARLKLKEDLKNRSGQTLAAAKVTIVPAQLAAGATKFKLHVDAAGCPAGVYRGAVLAWTSQDLDGVEVEVKVP